MTNHSLQRKLNARQIIFMALGAAIGVGLFLGSAQSIKTAGPSVLIAYTIAGVAVYFIVRALGEMTVEHPVSGSFSTYASQYLGPLAGFITGWNYWIMMTVIGIAETTAVGIYMKVWYPDTPQWIWVLGSVAIIGSFNLIAVKAYAELEFWFALIKIVTIILLILGGTGMIFLGWGNGGKPFGLSGLWTNGGWFPNGISGMIFALPIVVFAFAGSELIGLTAAEAENPEQTIPKAINSVLLRILFFYVGALTVILSIYPWNQIGTEGSPFVLVFEKLGITKAAGIMNFVVITAALSSFNCSIFASSRMLYGMGRHGDAPKWVSKTDSNGVPARSVYISITCLIAGVLLNYLFPSTLFHLLILILSFATVWTWLIVILAHYRFKLERKKQNQGPTKYPMIIWPFSSWFSLAFLLFLIGTMAYDPESRMSLVAGIIWTVILITVYIVFRVSKRITVTREIT